LVFSTPLFLFLFLPVVLLASALAPRAARNAVLLAASLLFYAWGEQEIVLVMIASIAVNWTIGLWVGRRRSRLAIGLAVAFNLGLLVAFKYSNFLADNLSPLLVTLGLPALELEPIRLPIGISFFTFQALSYVIDVYRRDGPPQRHPVDFGLYIALFPQLIAGPIVRYRDIAAQLLERRRTRAGFAEGVRRFVIGLAKKVLIANTVAVSADSVFALEPGAMTPATAWLGVACYTVQIYFDFSGYSDMAIGLGRMLGFRFLENFRWPYVSQSITEFWRRWHISLSTWFRDYLYIPLGGNRGRPILTYRNLVLVFLLCGLWHGASWSFVVWGAFHGVFLVLERAGLGAAIARMPRAARHGYALLVAVVGWVFFRAETLTQALGILRVMAGLGGPGDPAEPPALHYDTTTVAALVVGAVGSAPVLPALGRWRERIAGRPLAGPAVELASVASLVTLLVVSASFLASGTHNPFIYFRF